MILWYSLWAASKISVNLSVNCKAPVVCIAVDIGRALAGKIGGRKEFKSVRVRCFEWRGPTNKPSLEDKGFDNDMEIKNSLRPPRVVRT